MGNNLFGANISGQIAAALGPLLLPATLVKVMPGTRGADPTTGTNPTSVSYSCRGMIDTYDQAEMAESAVITVLHRKVLLLGDTISSGTIAPDVNDQVTIEGKTYSVDGITDRDPDRATYTLACLALAV